MSKIEEKDPLCCQDTDCNNVESCDCQGICTCESKIDFETEQDDCDDCCCGDDDDDDDDECDDLAIDCEEL